MKPRPQQVLPWDLTLACDGLAALERLGPHRARLFTEVGLDGPRWSLCPTADLHTFGEAGLIGRDAGGWHLTPAGGAMLGFVIGCANLKLSMHGQDDDLIWTLLGITDPETLRRRWRALHPGQAEPGHGIDPRAALDAAWDWTGTAGARMPADIRARMEIEGKALLRWILDQPSGPALHHAVARMKLGPKLIAPTLEWLLQTLVLAPVQDPDDGLVRLTAAPPVPIDDQKTVLGGWTLDDVLAIIPHLAAGLVPRRQDGKLAVKAVQTLGAVIAPLPVSRQLNEVPPERRIEMALNMGALLDLVPLPGGRADERERLAERLSVAAGDLLRPMADRMRAVVRGERRTRPGTLGMGSGDHRLSLTLLHVMDGGPLLINDILTRATRRYLADQPVMLPHVTEDVEYLLFNLLLTLGFARITSPGIALTPEGRYALGLTDAWPEHPPLAAQPFVVMPDHTLVFLSPHPGHELRLAAFAEPQPGPDRIGVRFRLTKASVQRGAGTGLDAEAMLARLAAGSGKPVPTHVAHEIRTWAGGIRRCPTGFGTVIHAPDAATAAAIIAACGKRDQARLLGDSVVFIPADADMDEDRLEAALAKRGIILDHTLDDPHRP